MNPQNKKSLDLDQDSQRNQGEQITNKIDFKEREQWKLILKLI